MNRLVPTCVLAVDAVIMTVDSGMLRVVVQDRPQGPYAGLPALPGVLVLDGETEAQAVRRMLSTKVEGVGVYLSPVATFSDPGRDPRGRVVSVAWGALVSRDAAARLRSSDGLSLAAVAPDGETVMDGDGEPLSLAFDHATMVSRTVGWLRDRLRHDLTGAEMLDEEFTLGDLREVYEAVYGRALDAPNFHGFVQARGLVVPTGRKAIPSGRGRPGKLYRAAPRPAAPWEV